MIPSGFSPKGKRGLSVADEKNRNVHGESQRPNDGADIGQPRHVHHDVDDAQKDKDKCQDVDARLVSPQLVRNDDRTDEKR